MNTRDPCTHSGELEALLSPERSCLSCSGPRSPCLPHEGAAALLCVLPGGLVGVHHYGVLIHQLAGGVAERGQWQRDALHFTLVNLLLVLLLQVFAPVLQQKPKHIHG